MIGWAQTKRHDWLAMTELGENVLLRDLAVVMIVAGVVTLLFHRLRQPVVLGYILAGVIIGPHTPPFPLIRDEASIRTLAELGVVLLMFGLGLHFSLRQLRRVGTTAFSGALLEILGMLWIGYLLGQAFGWSRMDSLFLGALLSISSTTITVKVLAELGKTKAEFAQLSLGILVVEDILAIAMLVFLSAIATTGGLAAGTIAITLVKIGAFMVMVVVVGLIAVPRLLHYVARYRSDEMLLVTVLGLCFGVALLAWRLGYSVALGAFLIGTIVGEAREIGKVRLLTEPVRDMFSAVFFVSTGMLIDPRVLLAYAGPIAAIAVTVVVGKVVTRFFGVIATGRDIRTSLQVGMTLAQIGEFSFIIAALGQQLQATSAFLFPIAVSVSAVTTLLTPYLIRASDPAVVWFDRVAPRAVVSYLAMYHRWLEGLRRSHKHSQARLLVRKWAWQIALNVALVTGVFLAAPLVAARVAAPWPQLPRWIGGANGVVWLGAAVIALPGLIAALRKLQALALLLAELSVTETAAGKNTLAVRTFLSNTMLLAGILGVALWVLVISATLLPPWPALVVMLAILAVVTVFFWRFFLQVHAKGQLALRETLTQPPLPEQAEGDAPALAILKDAQLATVTLPPACRAAGKLIRELELRTRTGASIVGIERAEVALINPGPDEELKAGDRIVLLGQRAQLDAARGVMLAPPAG